MSMAIFHCYVSSPEGTKKNLPKKLGQWGGSKDWDPPHWFEFSRCDSVPIWHRHGGCCCLGCLGHWRHWLDQLDTPEIGWFETRIFFPAASKQDRWHSKPFPTGSFSEVRIWGKWCKPRRHPSHLLKLIQLANFAKSVTRGNPKHKPDLLTQFLGVTKLWNTWLLY